MIIIFRAFLAMILIGVCLIWAAHADDMEAVLRKHYFDAAKRAITRESEPVDQVINCCGVGDAVRAKVIGQGPGGLIITQIVDVMQSANGKVGDVVPVPSGKVTVRLYSPFAEPILFINAANQPYCLSFPAGG